MIRTLFALCLIATGCAQAPGSGAPDIVAAFPPPGATALPAAGTAYDNGDIAQAFGRLAFDAENDRERRGLLRLATPVAILPEGVPVADDLLQGYATWLQAQTGVRFVPAPVPGGGRIHVRMVDAGLSTSLVGAACALVAGDVSVEALQRDPATAIARTTLGTGTLEAATIFLPRGAPGWRLEGCLAEEVPQALGLMNDLPDLGPSAFNDDGVHRWPTALDLLMIRVLHDPALAPGLARPEAEEAARALLERINPQGTDAALRLPLASSRRAEAYMRVASTVFAPQTARAVRLQRANEALELAPARVPSLHCSALLALGQAERGVDPGRAVVILGDARRVCAEAWPDDVLRGAVIDLERAASARFAGQQALADRLAGPLPPVFGAFGQPRRAEAARGLLSTAASGTGAGGG